MKVLITGVTGFVGGYLADYILRRGPHEVWGFRRWRSDLSSVERVASRIRWVECDIHDAASVNNAIRKIRPDRIFHLAAQSFVPTSWHAPTETLTDNLIGELNLLEAVRELKLDCPIQIAGSSEEYGLVLKNEVPVTETNPLRPLSPYGVSKVGQDLLAYQYFMSYGIHAVRTRAFNHTGPGRPAVFAASGFTRQIALIRAGKQEPVVSVGNLDAIRDFTDVRDMVRAYWLSLEKCKAGEVYNICSGDGWSMRQVLNSLLKISNLRVKVALDPKQLRPSDVPVLIGDCSKFRRATGWKPLIPFEHTLRDLLAYWQQKVQSMPSLASTPQEAA